MLTTPEPATFQKIVGDDPCPGVVRPMLDWQAAAKDIHAAFGAPSYAVIGDIEFNLERARRRYCVNCEHDHGIATQDQHDRDLRRGDGKTYNPLVWYLKKNKRDIQRRLQKTPGLAKDLKKLKHGLEHYQTSLRAIEFTKAQREAEFGAYLKNEFGADIQRIVMPRDRRRKTIASRPAPKAARALKFPVKKISQILGGQKNSSHWHRRLADAQLLKDIKAIGDWLSGNREFKLDQRINWDIDTKPDKAIPLPQFCVETFLKTADPGRFPGAGVKPIAYWADLPSSKLYRAVAAELAKNPT
jgi:hypothetical protein